MTRSEAAANTYLAERAMWDEFLAIQPTPVRPQQTRRSLVARILAMFNL